jgi:hypothetical protein
LIPILIRHIARHPHQQSPQRPISYPSFNSKAKAPCSIRGERVFGPPPESTKAYRHGRPVFLEFRQNPQVPAAPNVMWQR